MGCQRALKAQGNIVIDVQICSPGGSAQAPSLVAQISNRIPTNKAGSTR
ncbi:sensor domain-containing protein [Mycolicibacterium sp. P9-64]|nr:sensor domain-containing protein [Mycolicibacterium sp. P9-64]